MDISVQTSSERKRKINMRLLLILCILIIGGVATLAEEDKVFCSGKYDIVLINDGSQSIIDPQFKLMKEFDKKLVKNFSMGADEAWFGLFQFSNGPGMVWELDPTNEQDIITYDQTKMLNTIDSMTQLLGSTDIFTALEKVAKGIEEKGRDDVQNWIFLVTDAGHNSGKTVAELEALSKSIRDKGTIIWCIGIGSTDIPQLTALASEPKEKFAFFLDSFDELAGILQELLEGTCITLTARTPTELCAGAEGQTLNITGTGFADTGELICQFQNENSVDTANATFVNSTYITCNVPVWNDLGEANVQVSMDNGKSFAMSPDAVVIVNFNPCPDMVAILGSMLGVLGALGLIPLGAFLLMRRRKGAAAGGAPTSLLGAILIPPAQKKWHRPNIEYLWPGIGQGAGGGARPVYIEWGDAGAPPDRVLADGEVDTGSGYSSPGCWESFKMSISQCWNGFTNAVKKCFGVNSAGKPQQIM